MWHNFTPTRSVILYYIILYYIILYYAEQFFPYQECNQYIQTRTQEFRISVLTRNCPTQALCTLKSYATNALRENPAHLVKIDFVLEAIIVTKDTF